NDGLVGIGTYSPGAKLQINGSGNTSATTALTVQNSDGVNLLRVRNDLNTSINYLRFGNSFTASTYAFPFFNDPGTPDPAGTNLSFYNYTGANSAVNGAFAFAGNNFTQTSGNHVFFRFGHNFFPTSGNATYSAFTVRPSITQSGGANGITRGFHVDPILGSAADWRSIEWSNSSGYGLYGAGTANNYLGGSLGIGATTPSRTLHVAGEARITDLTTDTPTRIVGADADGDLGEITLGSGLSITSGVLNTSSTLNTGSGTAGQVTFWNGTNSITGSNNLFWDNSNSRLGVGTNTPGHRFHVTGSSSRFENSSGTFELDIVGGGTTSRIVSTATGMALGTLSNNALIFWMNANERMRINSTTGHVGINQTSPSARLHVVGAGTTTDYGLIVTDVNNNTATASLVVQDNGRVGIGTNVPATKLDVIGDVEFQNPTTSYDGGILGSELLSGAGATTGWTGTSFITGGFKHDSLTTPLVSTFSPANNQFYQVAIAVTGRTAGSFTFTFGGYTSSSLTASFTVGPLTTSTGALTITPTADFNGTITASVKVITNGTPTFIGKNSAGSTAYEERYYSQFTNMSLGAFSGRKITTGFNNVLLGYQAGVDVTTGINNVFLGYRSGFKNTIGDNNMFIGNSAGFENLSGKDNAFIGGSAGYANTSGIYNVAIGSTSLRLNTSGSSNI
ncbi:MAG: beta strand repeat-containing protein, partial [Bacteroidota bacterium]